MKRDMDLVREILLLLEAKPDDAPTWGHDLPIPGKDPLSLGYHSNKLADAGLIVYEPVTTESGRVIKVLVFSLSWAGHEYLETIRDPDTWERTKAGARKVGGFSLEVLNAIAKGLIKKKIRDLTDLDVDL